MIFFFFYNISHSFTMMLGTYIFILLCVFKCIDFTSADCNVSPYKGGIGNQVKCSNSSFQDVLQSGGPFVSLIIISNSNLQYLMENSFTKYAKNLIILQIQKCNISNIHNNAFAALKNLKKLTLSYNNITELNPDIFKPLESLEYLNLGFNSIRHIEKNSFPPLQQLKLLDLNDNQLVCLEPEAIQSYNSLMQFRILKNPLNLTCRGRLTLWLRDRGINYSDQSPNKKENWLDSLLWRCAIENPVTATSENEMRQCIIFYIFNQFKSAVQSTSDFTVDSYMCNDQVINFLKSIENNINFGKSITNGQAIEIMLYSLQNSIMLMNQ